MFDLLFPIPTCGSKPQEDLGGLSSEGFPLYGTSKRNLAVVHLFFTETQFQNYYKSELIGISDFLCKGNYIASQPPLKQVFENSQAGNHCVWLKPF
ncbi:hypothetical protein C0J52_12316 [Blattella germanica]|nr:hypothetical protein C0J52_12316 [Blattella germanica]